MWYKFLFDVKNNKITVEEYTGTVCFPDKILVTLNDNFLMYSKDNDVRKFYDKAIGYFMDMSEECDSMTKKCVVLKGVIENLKNQPSKCPFCGGEAKSINYNCLTYKIKCKACGSETKNFESEREAVDAWNKRV